MKLHPCLLLISVLATLNLASCVDPSMSGGGFNTYSSLPRSYSGNAYDHHGRYYTGGQHQTGSYNYQGRSYDSRYYHNGQYFYGGQHQNYPQPGNGSYQHSRDGDHDHDRQQGNYQQGSNWMDRR